MGMASSSFLSGSRNFTLLAQFSWCYGTTTYLEDCPSMAVSDVQSGRKKDPRSDN